MQTKQIGIISGITVIIAVASVMAFTVDLKQDIQVLEDQYAMNVDSVSANLESNEIYLVDIRTAEAYAADHIPGSSIDYLYGKTLEKRVNTIQNRIPEVASSAKIVLVDEDGTAASKAAELMNKKGIETYYLQEGISSWNEELSTTSTSKTIDAEQLWSQIQQNEDIYILDVRQPEEFDVTQISTSVNIPLADIFSDEIKQIPDDKPVVVVCGSGNRATIATYAMALEGIDFQVLDGGIIAWDAYLEQNNLESI